MTFNKNKQFRNPYFSSAPRLINHSKIKKEEDRIKKDLEVQLRKNAEPITSFVNRVKSVKPLPKEKKYLDGWTYISKVNGKIVRYDHNISSLNEEREKTPYEIMDEAIYRMRTNWINYKINYDEVHGEGAYEEAHEFKNPIIYESDTDEETESEETDEDIS